MVKRTITTNDILKPENILNNLINDYIEGNLDYNRFLYRAVVIKIDHEGGKFDKTPPNPKNSIKARVLTDGMDSFLSDDDLLTFWPLFPFDLMPIKESEHVYVIFEDELKRNGLWVTRIPEPNNIDNPNLVNGIDKYKTNKSNNLSDIGNDSAIADVSEKIKAPKISNDFVVEKDIPKYKSKTGERVIEGSNNSVIVFGLDENQKQKAGNISVVVGRTGEEIDLINDKSSVHVSMKMDVDNNLNITVGEPSKKNPDGTFTAVIALKTDEIRLVARNGMKLIVEDGDIYINGSNVILGEKNDITVESAVLGDTFSKHYFNHMHNSAVGLTTKPMPDSSGILPQQIISKTIKIKK